MNKMVMRTMMGFYLLFSLLPLMGLTVAGQEEAIVELIHSYPSTQKSPIAITLTAKDLPLVSSNVVGAEAWLKTHVFAHYPSTNITTIVVGSGILCNSHRQHQWSLILPCLKNLKHSLTRWGLLNEIKPSVAFSSNCFHLSSHLNPLLSFLQSSNFPYTINPSPHSIPYTTTHQELLKTSGFDRVRDIRMMMMTRRKLSNSGFAPVPGTPLSFAPTLSPPELGGPANPPLEGWVGSSPMPLCIPPAEGPSSEGGGGEKARRVWCVAKPAVPAEKLQEAVDYACGVVGTECEEIKDGGECFHPDNLVAHASYVFNSYWQQNKRNGGSCNFNGTAILVNSDPSYRHCQFELS